ncbi:serine-rich adhesin for platelets-like isoform X2 [Haliotis asinina]|uniref:serine-rich adhesin for platelets-like isoform X2 n=1 Tax=Haliotis asinina TaxID=109174 RepID=UPI003531F87E
MGQVLSRKRSASANITAHKSDDVTANTNGDVVKAEANGSATQSTGDDTKVDSTDTDGAPVKEKKKRRRFFFSLKRTRPGSGRKKKAKKDRNGQVNADTSGSSSKSGLFMDEFQIPIPEDDGIDSVSLSSNEEKDNKKRKDSGIAIRRSKRNSNSKNGKKKKKKSEKKKEEKSKKKKNSKDEGKNNVVVTAADGSLNINKSVEPLHESVEAAVDEAKVLALSEENGTKILTSDNAAEEDLVAAVTAVMDSSVSKDRTEAVPSAEEIVAPSTAKEGTSAPSTEKESFKEEGRELALQTIVESSAQEELLQSVEAAVQEAAPYTETTEAETSLASVTEVDKKPVSPAVSNAGDNGVLKQRVSLGPRLKTAILKKYSGAGDAPPETRVTLTKPKIVEVTDLVPPPRKNRPRRTLSQTASTTSSGDLNTSTSSSVSPSSPKTDEDTATVPEKSDVESVVAQTSIDLNTNDSSDVDPSASTIDKDKNTEVTTPERLDVESVVAQAILSSCDVNTDASSPADPSASTFDMGKDTTVSSSKQLDVESIVTQTFEVNDLNTNVSHDVDSSATVTNKDTTDTARGKSDIQPTVAQELKSSTECSSHVDTPPPRTDEDIQGIFQGKTDTESDLTSTIVNVVDSQITTVPDIEVTGVDGSTVNDAGSVLNADTQRVVTEAVLAPLEASVALVENEHESPVKAIPLPEAVSGDGAGSEVVSSTTLADQTETAVDDMETKATSLSIEPAPKGEAKGDSTPSESAADTSLTEHVTSREPSEVMEETVTSQSKGMVEECTLKDIEIYVEPTKTFEAVSEKPDTTTEPVIVIERIHTEPYFGPLPGSEDGQNDDAGDGGGVLDVTDATKQKFSRETGEVCKECVCEVEVQMKADEEIAEVKNVMEVDEISEVAEKVMKVSSEIESNQSDHLCVSDTAETPSEVSDERSTNEDSSGLQAEDHDESSSTATDSTIVDEDEHNRTLVEEKNASKEAEEASDERKPAICNGDSNGLAHESGSDSSSSVTTETSQGQEQCKDTAVAHEGDRKVVVDGNDGNIETLVDKVNSQHDSSSQSDRDMSDNNNSKIIISSEQETILETIQKVSDPSNLVLSGNHTPPASAETVAGE